MDRIESVAVFVEVAEHRSFVAAARRLKRSPAAVTRAVGELETRLGVRLLNRTTRAVSLTEAGARFLAGARRVPADLGAHGVVACSGVAGVERWIFRNETGETSVAIRPRLIVTTAEAALDVVRADFGITRVLSYQAADDIARGSLLRLLPAHEGHELPIHLLYPGGRHPPPKLRAFLDFAKPRLRRR